MMGEIGRIRDMEVHEVCPQHRANTPCASDVLKAGVVGGPMTRIRAVWLAERAVSTVFVD